VASKGKRLLAASSGSGGYHNPPGPGDSDYDEDKVELAQLVLDAIKAGDAEELCAALEAFVYSCEDEGPSVEIAVG